MIDKISDGVYEVKNFLTEDEIHSLLLSASPDGFIESHIGNIVKDLIPESTKCIPEISQRIMSYFENATSHTQITKIRRLKDNEFMHEHIDGGYPQIKKRIVFGIAIYLNDNFEGGELSYPKLNLSIKPIRSSMVIHEAQLPHKVLPVTNGSRYSITTFIFGDDTTKIKM